MIAMSSVSDGKNRVQMPERRFNVFVVKLHGLQVTGWCQQDDFRGHRLERGDEATETRDWVAVEKAPMELAILCAVREQGRRIDHR